MTAADPQWVIDHPVQPVFRLSVTDISCTLGHFSFALYVCLHAHVTAITCMHTVHMNIHTHTYLLLPHLWLRFWI